MMTRIAEKRVIIFGVGGVGSWCAESLIRSGIRQLTIVDNDCVSVTNVNRQLMATTETVGRVKTEVLRERLLTINPEAEITAIHGIYSEDTSSSYHLEEYDYIVDAIDSLKDKVHLILTATRLQATEERKAAEKGHPVLFSSMGAALKMDPTRVHVAEFWDAKGCPLARALRQRFKRDKQFPGRKFKVVYSDELLPNIGTTDETCEYKAQINGTIAHITAIFGFTLAGLIMQHITQE